MLVGDLIVAAAVVNVLALGINIGWMCNNWRMRERARAFLGLAKRIHDDALALEYKVCPTCGHIVQGLCLECTANLSVEE